MSGRFPRRALHTRGVQRHPAGIGLGLFNALITLIEQVESPCRYSPEVAALSSGALLLSGLVGAGLSEWMAWRSSTPQVLASLPLTCSLRPRHPPVSVLMEQTKAYSLLQKACVVLAGGAMVFMLASLVPERAPQVVASFGCLGFFLVPLLPVNLESAAEATYPVPEDNSAAVVLSLGQVFGIVRGRGSVGGGCLWGEGGAGSALCQQHPLPPGLPPAPQVYTFALPALLGVGPSVHCSSVVTPFAAFVRAARTGGASPPRVHTAPTPRSPPPGGPQHARRRRLHDALQGRLPAQGGRAQARRGGWSCC